MEKIPVGSFVFYDLETFGLNTQFDRIAQFACVRTDSNLSIIEEPVVLYCKPPLDYVPVLEACLTSGITPMDTMEKGLSENDFINKINDIFCKPGTCVCGYNSINFDDEMIRNAAYRNFVDPYKWTYYEGCSRMDILTLGRACHDIRPEGIVWPKDEKGFPTFRLEDIAKANNISHENAHDALADVMATLNFARLIKEKHPKLFEYYIDLRNKANLYDILFKNGKSNPVFFQSSANRSKNGSTTVLYPIAKDFDTEKGKHNVICFDLSKPTYRLFETLGIKTDLEDAADGADISAMNDSENAFLQNGSDFNDDSDLNKTKKKYSGTGYSDLDAIDGMYGLKVNKAPLIGSYSLLRSDEKKRLGLDDRIISIRMQKIEKNLDVIKRYLSTLNKSPMQSMVDDVDFKIYSRDFRDTTDLKVLSSIPFISAKERLSKIPFLIKDDNKELLFRHVCRNWPEVLDGENLKNWKSRVYQSLVCSKFRPENDIFGLKKRLKEIMLDSNVEEREKNICGRLMKYCNYLCSYVNIK